MRIHAMACLLLLPALGIRAQEAPTSVRGGANTATSVTSVPIDTKLIEEKSLLPWGGMGHPDTRMGFNPSPSGVPGDFRTSGPMFQDAAESRSNGIRLYGFTLAPKEKLLIKLECEDVNKISMKFAPPITPDSMVAEYKKANMPPRAVRSRRISIKNVTGMPYQVVLSLLGQANYHYKLIIERQP